MRLAFVSLDTQLHRKSEANDRFSNVIQLLHEQGNDVHVITAKFWDNDMNSFEREGITYHGIVDAVTATRSFNLRIARKLRALSPDIIHTQATPSSQIIASAIGAKLSRSPLVVEWYGTEAIASGAIRNIAINRPSRFIVPSRLVRTKIREQGVDGDRIDIIPNPIDTSTITNTSPGEVGDIVYSRELNEGANAESFLLGLAELRDREWRARVFGDGSHRSMYESLARDLRIDDRLTFAGETPLENRIAAYRNAHVFVQTATECVFPTEMLWALASGCIGIVEYHVNSSAHELVEGLERGFRTTSEQELADAILTAGSLERKDYDEQFERFDRSAIGDRYMQNYTELIENHGIL